MKEGGGDNAAEAEWICWKGVGGSSVGGTLVGGGWMLAVTLSVEGLRAERLDDRCGVGVVFAFRKWSWLERFEKHLFT